MEPDCSFVSNEYNFNDESMEEASSYPSQQVSVFDPKQVSVLDPKIVSLFDTSIDDEMPFKPHPSSRSRRPQSRMSSVSDVVHEFHTKAMRHALPF